MYTKNARRPHHVHSSSMFQPSLTRPDQAKQYKSTFKSCNSLSQNSGKSIRNHPKPNIKRSQSIRRSQFQIRSQSAGGVETISAPRKVLSTKTSDEVPKGSESLGKKNGDSHVHIISGEELQQGEALPNYLLHAV
jgi:hypothetical protein